MIVTISATIIYRSPKPTLSNYKTDWEAFEGYINGHLNINIRLKTTEEVEDATNHLITTIQDAGWKATPQPKNLKINSPNVPNEVMELVREKRKARARWQRSRNIEDRRKFNQLNNTLRNKLKENRNETFQTYLNSLSVHDNSLWRATKGIKQPARHIPPLQNQVGTWAGTEKEKAEEFAQHLETTFTPNSEETDEEVEAYLNAPLQMSLPIRNFTKNEIQQEINLLNNKKSPGHDLITAVVLKQLPEKGIRYLQVLLNGIVRLTYWPLQLKFAHIILIPKPGKPHNDVKSYRPISLLPLISKLLEKLILKRLNQSEIQNDWLPNHQFGFRTQHSTIQQCHRVVNTIQSALENKVYCSAVFLGVKQAFDRVWNRGLLYKAKNLFPHHYYLLLLSYLENRYFQTKVGDETSQIKQVKAGVPQGSVLGPLLYLLYTHDIPTMEPNNMGTFADDTVILACSENPATVSSMTQEHLILIEE